MSKYCPMCDAVTNCTENCTQCLEEEAKERSKPMYSVTIKAICWDADEVSNLIYKATKLWQLSKHAREICTNMQVGDVKKFEDADILIECIV